MAYNSLSNYYRVNFILMEKHKYSLTEIENMMIFERDIYIDLNMEDIKKNNK